MPVSIATLLTERSPVVAAELELALAHREQASLQERCDALLRAAGKDAEDGRADDPLGGKAEDAGEARVAVRDEPALAEGRDALAHLVHQDAVVVVGARQREDAVAGRPTDDDGVHLAAPDGVQRLLGLLEAFAQGAVRPRPGLGPGLADATRLLAGRPLRHV
jgi:hypothetical protein